MSNTRNTDGEIKVDYNKLLMYSMQALDYTTGGSTGICYGFACMGLQAVLTRNLKLFNDLK